MVDLILIVFVCAVFAGGFWCGKTFGSLSAMYQSVKSTVKGML